MNVLITGASSGIGRALAVECARRGDRLFLCGRDASRLDEALAECRALGASAHGRVVDVAEEGAMREWIRSCDDAAPLDRVFANAGVGTGVESEETILAEFPYQIRYKKTGDPDTVYYLHNAVAGSPLKNDDYVFYKDTTKAVSYAETLTVAGAAWRPAGSPIRSS